MFVSSHGLSTSKMSTTPLRVTCFVENMIRPKHQSRDLDQALQRFAVDNALAQQSLADPRQYMYPCSCGLPRYSQLLAVERNVPKWRNDGILEVVSRRSTVHITLTVLFTVVLLSYSRFCRTSQPILAVGNAANCCLTLLSNTTTYGTPSRHDLLLPLS